MKRKIWTFILLMVCALGIWGIYEKTPSYITSKPYGIMMRHEDPKGIKDYGAVAFRSLPIVAFGVGIYLLFLRKKR